MRWLTFTFGSQTAGGGNPASVAAHHLEDEYLGGSGGHGINVKAGFADRGGDVLGYGTEAWAAIGNRQVVVHGLGYVNCLDRVTHGFRKLGDLEAGVG